MSRQMKTAVVLAFELCLFVAMCASFAYFVLESRDFLAPATPPAATGTTVPAS